jgi:uncharacterized membrane protein YphA (DoxX/SURF4 family)
VHRFFSTFPGSWPGAGLFLLRVVVGGIAALQGAAYLTFAETPAPAVVMAALLAIASAIAILLGFVTPLAAFTAILSSVFLSTTVLPPSAPAVAVSAITPMFLTADAVSLAMLGPGALSIDARLFGRREVIIPRDE